MFSTMSLLLGLDAGGARHVLPDPARLPSSHQGQKIHRLLLGIPCPGSPLGTARYLPKKQPLASPASPQALSSLPSPARPELPRNAHAEAWQQAGAGVRNATGNYCPKAAIPTCQPGQLPPGKAEPALGLHLQKTAMAGHWSQCHCSDQGLAAKPRGQLALQLLLQWSKSRI